MQGTTSQSKTAQAIEPLTAATIESLRLGTSALIPSSFTQLVDTYQRINLGEEFLPPRPDYQRATFDPTKNVKIGITTPTVPPISVSVDEQKNVTPIQALRSTENYNIRSGRGVIRISLDMVFPSADLVNTELLEIIVQFKKSPFLTIESSYIADIVWGKERQLAGYESTESGIKRSLDSIDSLIKTLPIDIAKAWNDIHYALTSLTSIAEGTFLTGTINSDNLSNLIDSNKSKSEKDTSYSILISGLNVLKIKEYGNTVVYDGVVENYGRVQTLYAKQIQTLQQKVSLTNNLNTNSTFKLAATNILPVFLQSISLSSMSESIGGVRAAINLILFNHYPYVPKFLYRNSVGGPTPDIDKCWSWSWWVDREVSKLQSSYKANTAPSEFRWSTGSGFNPGNRQNESILTIANILFTNPSVDLDVRKDQLVDLSNIIVSNCVFTMANKFALHPVLSGTYPSIQYMGGEVVEGILELIVPDNRLGELHHLKKAIEQAQLSGTTRQNPENVWIELPKGSTPLSLLGTDRFVVTSTTTETIDTTHSKVEFRIAAVFGDTPEKLKHSPRQSGDSDLKRMGQKWELIWNIAATYPRFSPLWYQANEFLFGTSDSTSGFTGILTAESLYNIFLADPKIITEPAFLRLKYDNNTKYFYENVQKKFVDLRNTAIELENGTVIKPGENGSISKQIASVSAASYGGLLSPYLGLADYALRYEDIYRSLTMADKKEAVVVTKKILASIKSDLTSLLPTCGRFYELITSKEALYVELASITALDNNAIPMFAELSRFLDASIPEVKSTETKLYPDLNLPTYGEIIRGFLTVANREAKSRYPAWAATNDVGSLPQPTQAYLMSLCGAPKNKELGLYDIPEDELENIAVDINDTADPDFFFYRYSIIPLSKRSSEIAVGAISGLNTDPGSNDTMANLVLAMDKGKEILNQKISVSVSATSGNSTKTSPTPPPSGELRTVSSGNDISMKTGLEKINIQTSRDTFKRHLGLIKDDFYRMSRGYPTFKLYFIEEDSEALLLADDWFGYNAVISADVARHKYEPDLCQIQLLNVTGTLDEMGFYKIGGVDEIPSTEDTPDGSSLGSREPFTNEPNPARIKRFPIQEGTRIVLKLGYGSKEDHLETVFTGKIIELSRGEVIELVAQGYGMELTAPINTPSFDLDGFWWKSFKYIADYCRRPALVSLVAQILDSQPAEHFGSWGLREIVAAVKRLNIDKGRHQSPEGSLTVFGRGLDSVESRALFSDPRIRNVFSYIPLEIEIFKRSRDDAQHDEEHIGTWRVDGKTGLQVLKEITFNHPGWIFSVLPFDGRATLFMGRPNDLYIYTDKYERDKEREALITKYQLEKNQVTLASRIPGIERQTQLFGAAIQSSSNNEVADIITRFMVYSSEEFSAWDKNWNIYNNSGLIVSDTYSDAEFQKQIEKDRLDGQRLKEDLHALVPDEILFKALIRELCIKAYIFKGIRTLSSLHVASEQFDLLWRMLENPSANIKAESFSIEGFGDVALWLAGVKGFVDMSRNLASESSTRENLETDRLRKLLLLFKQFIHNNPLHTIGGPEVKALAANFESLRKLHIKGKKPVRNYHFVDSVHHILQNNIVATRAEMRNTVFVNCDKIQRLATIDDDIVIGDILPTIRSAPNAYSRKQQVLATYAHLADAMRPMYRGELIIRGNERIKPYDIVWILDTYNGVYGPIEVERVVHHFSVETGFTTTIVPHLYCEAFNSVSYQEAVGANIWFGIMGLAAIGAGAAVGAGLGASRGGLLGIVGGGVTGGYLAGDVAGNITNLEANAGILDCLFGNGSFGRKENPVAFVPLVSKGFPFVAGLRGFNPSGLTFWSDDPAVNANYLDSLDSEPTDFKNGKRKTKTSQLGRKFRQWKRGIGRTINISQALIRVAQSRQQLGG